SFVRAGLLTEEQGAKGVPENLLFGESEIEQVALALPVGHLRMVGLPLVPLHRHVLVDETRRKHLVAERVFFKGIELLQQRSRQAHRPCRRVTGPGGARRAGKQAGEWAPRTGERSEQGPDRPPARTQHRHRWPKKQRKGPS